MEISAQAESVWHVTVDNSGRVLLPSALRKVMHADPGTMLMWVRDKSGLRLQSFEESIRELQDYYCSLAPPEVCLTDELLAERKAEAAREQARS